MADRRFTDVPLPRFYSETPLREDAARVLAQTLPGTEVCLDDPYEDSYDLPRPRREPLGRVENARVAGDHVVADIVLFMDATGADRIAECLDTGELGFGLWGRVRVEGKTIHSITPTSVRLTRKRRGHGLHHRSDAGP